MPFNADFRHAHDGRVAHLVSRHPIQDHGPVGGNNSRVLPRPPPYTGSARARISTSQS
jgi:hypothetical protein